MDCSRIRSKVSSDWLPSHIKATRHVLAIFKMAGYFPDRPRKATNIQDGARWLDTRVDKLNTECRGTSCSTVSKELKRNEGMHGRKFTRNLLTDFWSLESENTYEHLCVSRDSIHATNMSFSLQPGHHPSLTVPNLQQTANQERYDQCGNQHHSRELLMMGTVMSETCWAYKKYNKITSGI